MGNVIYPVLLVAVCFGSAFLAMKRNRRRKQEGHRVPSDRALAVWVFVFMPLLVALGIWSILESSVVTGVVLVLVAPLISVMGYRQRSRTLST